MNTHRDQFPLPEDLKVFLTVIRKNGFASAAQALGFSPAYISKRISVLEATLSTKLLHRTTRRIALTDDGERVRVWAEKLLGDFDEFVGDIAQARHQPTGSLHICSSFGFGRNHVAPAIGKLSRTYPRLDIRLDVFDRVVDLVGEGFDLEIRVGDDLPGQHLGRKLASNRRVLCASPDYLERRGEPRSLDDLNAHDCLVLKERNNAFGMWTLTKSGQEETVRVGGPLSSNSGEIVLEWALSGGGILLRSMWDVRAMLDQGRLVQVLPEYSQSADVWAVYPTRLSQSAKLRVCVEFLEDCFRDLSVPWAANAVSPASS
ncbi:LysR family transcriptional regulator [Pseudomonas sp. Z5-35]|uniref:LysR substrate-binding domain-containing protein n=1 Tax=unclassified Pseudomonas TaxID=196821 RepID=UPI003DA8425F